MRTTSEPAEPSTAQTIVGRSKRMARGSPLPGRPDMEPRLHLHRGGAPALAPGVKCRHGPIGRSAWGGEGYSHMRDPRPTPDPFRGETLRKLAVPALGVAVALALPATALAQVQQNTYSVTASVTPKKQGSK